MPVNFSSAIAAYDKALTKGTIPGLQARDQVGKGDFADLVSQAAEGAFETLRNSETQSLQATAGKADLNEVVMAVSKADIALQTVVVLRDRVIQAYQDIMRMPI